MPHNDVVVWIDYDQACVSRFNRALAKTDPIKSYSSPASPGVARDLRAPDTARFFDDIAQTLGGADAILILGPGFERLELLVHLRKGYPDVADRILALETADRPRDDEIIPWACKHFGEEPVLA